MANSSISFKILHKDRGSKARVGELTTPHGIVETPAFVPVGTQATVKSLTPEDLQRLGVQILFGNTYHLHLRPGEDVIEAFGGLGKFMGFAGTTMTDSGGFQVFSLARARKFEAHNSEDRIQMVEDRRQKKQKIESGLPSSAISFPYSDFRPLELVSNFDIRDSDLPNNNSGKLVTITEDGVEFRSHLDGSRHFFTPEQSITIQKKLGADIMLSFDDCPPFPVTYDGAKGAMERTHRWAERSLDSFKRPYPYAFPPSPQSSPSRGEEDQGRQALYGIVQGSVFEDLRKESAKFIGGMDFDGLAIGGVAVGEGKQEMKQVVDWAVPLLPEEKVKHLLGVGDVDDIFEIIERGIDTFDCVTPTRLGRVGQLFVSKPEGNMENRFRIDVTKSQFAKDQGPLTQNCDCYACTTFTRGYVNHLFRAKELLGYHLATYHNVYFILHLVQQIREAIAENRFVELKKAWLV